MSNIDMDKILAGRSSPKVPDGLSENITATAFRTPQERDVGLSVQQGARCVQKPATFGARIAEYFTFRNFAYVSVCVAFIAVSFVMPDNALLKIEHDATNTANTAKPHIETEYKALEELFRLEESQWL